MSDKQNSRRALSLVAGWTFASSIGWAAGLTASLVLILVANKLPGLNEDRVFAYVTLILLGLTIGAAQWVVMRRYLAHPVRWLAATLVGHLLCLIVLVGGNLARLWVAEIWDDMLLLGLFGAAIGISQWWLLRQHYRNAGLWMLATAVGFLCFVWIVVDPAHSAVELVLRGTITGTLASIVPGMALVWMVRHLPSRWSISSS